MVPQPRDDLPTRAAAGGGAAALLVALLILLAVAPALAAPAVFGTLGRLERDIRGALAHVALLRDRLDHAALDNPAAESAGIADGQFGSTVASLRWAARGVDRRLDALRRVVGAPDHPDKAEILLIMRVELNSLLWALEELNQPLGLAVDHAATLERLHHSLEQLDRATAAMGTFAWPAL